MRRRRAGGLIALAALAALAASLPGPAAEAAASRPPSAAGPAASAASPARLSAALPATAVLGADAPLELALQIDTRAQPVPVTEIRLLYPPTIGVTTSGLGLDVCDRPPADFSDVLIDGRGLAGCPGNAVLATGSALGEVRIGPLTVPETALVTLLMGPAQDGDLSLVAFVDGQNPFAAKLAYAGLLRPTARPFGGELLFHVAQVPNAYEAELALVELRITIGAPAIVYRRPDGRRYAPDAVILPRRCPRGAFPFRAIVRFADGTSTSADATAACPHG